MQTTDPPIISWKIGSSSSPVPVTASVVLPRSPYAAHGATVVLLGKSVAKLEAVYDQIEAAHGPIPAIYPMHLEGASPHDYDELARDTQQFRAPRRYPSQRRQLPYLSRIKGLRRRRLAEGDAGQCQCALLHHPGVPAICWNSHPMPVCCSHHGRGRTPGKAYWGAYGVSKFAIEGLTQTLAAELDKAQSASTASTRARPAPPCANGRSPAKTTRRPENPGDTGPALFVGDRTGQPRHHRTAAELGRLKRDRLPGDGCQGWITMAH